MKYFLDTNVLLDGNKQFFENLKQKFYISTVSLEELENIKKSSNRDLDIKYKARKIIHWLIENQDKYEIIYLNSNDVYYFFSTIDSNDKKIIASATRISKEKEILFITSDLNCYMLAKTNHLNVQLFANLIQQDKYKGYINIYCNSDQELADFYNNYLFSGNIQKILPNEYILIYDKERNLIDKYKYISPNQVERIHFATAESKMFGTVKPIDPYQELAMDSLKHNQITLLKGPAGTGKSLLSLAYLFKLLEENKIDRIIIFCNTVATAGSAKLGFYPGDRTQKLLDSQIGNFLISKLGDRIAVEQLIDQNKLLLLPMSDIRGFDTSGMKAGIYITQAQNLNIELMKLALQRIGEDSICILDGDNEAQVDLNIYSGQNNGLKRVSQVFRGQPFYGEVSLEQIHRSKIAEIANLM